MRTIGLAELRARLGTVISSIRPGEHLTVTLHGRPIARITGVNSTDMYTSTGHDNQPIEGKPVDNSHADQYTPVQTARSDGTECGQCGTMLDPNGACFACRSR